MRCVRRKATTKETGYLLTYLLTYLGSLLKGRFCAALYSSYSPLRTLHGVDRLQKSSAAAEIARDADDVDHKFSEVTVHQTKKRHRMSFKFTQYYAK